MPKSLSAVMFMLSWMLFCQHTVAQPEAGQVGIAASLQDLQLDFTLPIWASDRVVIAPSVGLLSTLDRDTDLDLGASFRVYTTRKKLSPYVGIRSAAFILMPKNERNVTDLLFGLFFGGEYFLDTPFSVGAELQLNIAFSSKSSNRFGNPGETTLNNATALHATFYF